MQPRAGQHQYRSRFLDAAWQLGCAGGYQAIKIRSIADQIGVSAALIYAYFEDKASLMEELRTMGAQRLATMLESEAREHPAGLPRLCELYLAYVREFAWLYVDGVGLGAEDPCARMFFMRAADVLVDAQPPGASIQLALHLWIGLQGILAATQSSRIVDDAVEHEHLQLLFVALGQSSSTTPPIGLVAREVS